MDEENRKAIGEYAKVKHAFVDGQRDPRCEAELHLARAILDLEYQQTRLFTDALIDIGKKFDAIEARLKALELDQNAGAWKALAEDIEKYAETMKQRAANVLNREAGGQG